MDKDPTSKHKQSEKLKEQYKDEPEKLERDQIGNDALIKELEETIDEAIAKREKARKESNTSES